jgi:hypothetical protein
MLDGIREAIGSLESRLDKRLQAFEDRMDRRFEQVDQRFEQVDRRLESLDAKVSRQFVWLVGLYVTTLVAMIGALGGIIAAILAR